MYADRIEAESRSVKSRLSGGPQLAGDRTLSTVRGKITFKRSGTQSRGKGRSNVDDKWQHDLYEDAQTFAQPQANGGGDLRAFLTSKQQSKGGGSRSSALVGSPALTAAKAAVAAASDLRQQLSGGRRRSGRLTTRRKPAAGGSLSAPSAAQQAQKRITVTLRNDNEQEDDDGSGEFDAGGAPSATVVRGGRGSLLVSSRISRGESEGAEEEGMDVDDGAMAGQTRSMTKGSQETLASFLSGLGLAKYTATFAAEEIDMPALLQMKEADLKELGIPMGPRKKILQAAEGL